MFGELDRYLQKSETRPPSYTTHKLINFKWNKDLNVRPETIKIQEENIGSKFWNIAHSKFLLEMSPPTRETKEKK